MKELWHIINGLIALDRQPAACALLGAAACIHDGNLKRSVAAS